MPTYLSTEKLVTEAKKHGVDFGKGDPYNRLRYYTKMEWMPHMIRKKDNGDDVKGHYPTWALGRLILIEKLKSHGYNKEEISKKMQSIKKWDAFYAVINPKALKAKIIIVGISLVLLLVLLSEMGIIPIGKPKSYIREQVLNTPTIN